MSSQKINKFNKNENFKEEKIISEKTDIVQIKKDLIYYLNNIKIMISRNNFDDNISRTINEFLVEIHKIIEILINSLNLAIFSKNQNEIIQRKDEQNIRNLYGKLFNEKLVNEILENKLYILKKKEKEYELLKQKTGAIVCNGKIICNQRKDNEIIILRTENSLLKTAIKNNEDLIKAKNSIIDTLNNDILLYKTQIKELRLMKTDKFSSFSNINININEPKTTYNNKNINPYNDKSYINSIQMSSSSSKKNKKINYKENYQNKVFSSYQINSRLINKSNNSSKKGNKDDYLRNKNSFKKDNIEQNITNDNSFKYISVNKSLFSPKKESKPKVSNNNLIKKSRQIKKNKLINNKIFDKDFNTISNKIHKRKEAKLKKNSNINNNRIYINHRKANSIQFLENSLKNMNMNLNIYENKEKSFTKDKKSNNNSYNLFSVLRKISEIKNKSLKRNSDSVSITTESLNNNKQDKEKYLNYEMEPYLEKKNDSKGRNEKYINNTKTNRENSFSFMNKSVINKDFMNKTTYDNYY